MDYIDIYLKEDLGEEGDITTNSIFGDEEGEAVIIANEDCILAGIEDAKEVFSRLGANLEMIRKDGEEVEKGEIVAKVKGKLRSILAGERLALNMISRMSGIATETRKLVDMCRKINPDVKIAATRKTTPGFRKYEKKAVIIGGGDPHRFGLFDAVLIKDNHIRVIGDTAEAVRLAKEKSSFTKLVEVEVRTPEDAVAAAKAGADIIMFDNMDPEDIRVSIDRIRELGLREKLVLEVSGGINLENVDRYAVLDVDVISTSFITLSPKPIDLTLKIHTLETTSREQV